MIVTNASGDALTSSFTDAIDSSVLSTRTRVMIDWLDSRHMEYTDGSDVVSVLASTNDAHASSDKGTIGGFFGPSQAGNGWERQSFLWGVCGAMDVNGHVIRADGRWHAMPDDDSSRYEFGWWSGSTSSASDGSFTTPPYVQIEFDDARCSHIRVNTSEFYGQVNSIKVEYRLSGSASWTVHAASASIGDGSYYYESAINNEDYLTLTGLRVSALSTRNNSDYARFNEIIPIYREDISSYVVSVGVNKVHSLHDSSLPIGSTAANSGTLSLDNTSGRFSPFSTSGVGAYMRKDVKVTIDLGVLTDEVSDTYEYVPFGSFWVDNWNISHSMTVQGQFRDYTKFLSELVLDDGFFVEDTLAGRAVADLALKTNFPKADVSVVQRFPDEVINKGGLVHLEFKDGNPFVESASSNVADNGVWGHWWNKAQERYNPIEDIDIEYNAFRDSVRTIDVSGSPLVREIVSSSSDALVINELNNGVSDVFTSAQASGGYTEFINARFFTFYSPPASSSTKFRFTVKNGGIRVWFNDALVVDEYGNVDTPYNTDSSYIYDAGSLRQGGAYKILVDYYHWYGTQKIVWEVSTDGGATWSDVPTSSTYLAIASDSLGSRETYGSSYDHDHFNHGVYLNSSSSALLSQSSGMTSDSSSKATAFNNNGNSNYQYVKVPYDVSMNSALSSSARYTGGYSMEILAQFDYAIGGDGVYAGNIDDASSASVGWGLFYTSSANGVYLYDGSQMLTASSSDTTKFSQSLWTHVAATYDGTTLKYYVNGSLEASAAGSGHTSWAGRDYLIGKSSDSSSGSSADYYFDGKFDEFVLYDKALSADEVLENYYSINVSELPYYDYLWGNSVDVFNLMQEIATADLGMFYFDESGVFNYHHYNRLYETFIDQHSTVQKTLSDDSFVIGGSTPIDLQANKVTVQVSNPTVKAAGLQGLWRPPSPSTVTVAGLSVAMTVSETSMTVTTTEGEYPWYESGYLKVGDEIIQYNSKTSNTFEGLTRGLFGTTAATHATTTGGSTTKVKEVKYFQIKYGKAPALDVKRPLVAAIDFQDPVLAVVDVWEATPFGAEFVISASESVGIGDLVYLEGKNDMNSLEYFVSVAGVPVNVQSASQQVVRQSAENHPSIKKYGLKSIEIANKFITSATWADTVASFIRDKFQDVVMVLSVNIAGVPQLQLGDRIKIGTFDNLSISNKEYWIIQIDSKLDGGVQQKLILREAS
jgi:hypothetical protein